MHRVLVIAEAANPEWVSVPLVGWSLAQALRDVTEAHLVTQVRNRDAILRAGLVEGRDVTFIDTENLARPLHRISSVLRMGSDKGWTTVAAINMLSYPYFEHKVWSRFGASVRGGDFDVVHRITPLTPTAISPIAGKCAAAGVPFVMGPINGGVPWPKGFETERRREREWLSGLRGAFKLLPGRQRMLKHASAILTGSRQAESEIPDRHRAKTFWLPENSINPERFNRVAAPFQGGPLRACFIGRLVPLKGVDMLLEAAAPLLRNGQLTVDIIGDGPMREALEAQVVRDGADSAVVFHGRVEHQTVQDIAATTQIMVFPSIREFGGGAVLEAMALGVVPVVVDYAGPGELVDDAVGYKVPIGPRHSIVAELSTILEQLVSDPAPLAEKSAAARTRVLEDFTWSAKARQVCQVYDWILRGSPNPPPRLL